MNKLPWLIQQPRNAKADVVVSGKLVETDVAVCVQLQSRRKHISQSELTHTVEVAAASRFCPVVLSLRVVAVIAFDEEAPLVRRLIGEVDTEEKVGIVRVAAPIIPHFIGQCELTAQLVLKQQMRLKADMTGQVACMTASGNEQCTHESNFRQALSTLINLDFRTNSGIGDASVVSFRCVGKTFVYLQSQLSLWSHSETEH